jgi:DivIVA domain-containing protein
MKDKLPELLSERLTPNEVKNKEFKRALWGYLPSEVASFLNALAECWQSVQRREKQLIGNLETAGQEIAAWKAREIELDTVREKATKEGQAIREESVREAERILTEAMDRAEEVRQRTENWLASVISVVEETEKQRDTLVIKLRTALDQHYALLENDKDTTRPLVSELGEFLKDAINPREGSASIRH